MAEQGHIVKRSLDEIMFYPEHTPRAQDPNYHIFDASRNHLINVLKVGCWIGGATIDDLKAGLPPTHRCYGAKQLEAHHEIAEFAGLSEIDWQKVAQDFPTLGIHSNEDFLQAAESEGGLTILCDRHHRSPRHGVHSITYPAWKLDRLAVEGWEFIP